MADCYAGNVKGQVEAYDSTFEVVPISEKYIFYEV